MLAPGARRVVRRRVPAGLIPEIGRADGLRRRVRPRRARRGASEAGARRARRPRQPPRRGLAAPTYAMLPCPRARMASQRVSERLEHVDDPHLMTRRTLPLVGERTWRHVQGRVAVPPSLPLGIERTVSVRSEPSGSASGTFGVEWQCVSHCHSGVNVPGSAPYTATRCRAYHIGTFRGEWQCRPHCHSGVSVPGSAPYTATRHRAYRIGTFRVEWQCWPERTPNPQPSRRLESGPTGQMRSGNRPPGRRRVAPEPAGLGLGPGRTERRSLGRGPR